MILTIDIGNTTVSFGGVTEDERVRFMTRLDTNKNWTGEEYAEKIRAIFVRKGVAPEDFIGTVISSVVPAVSKTVGEAIRSILDKDPMLITTETDTGLIVDLPEPDKVGRDRLVDAAWAAEHFPLPVVTADLGTATTFNVVKKGNVFCGGVIAAGVCTGLNALAERAAQLPEIQLQVPDHVIGRNTTECMLSGAVAGTAAMLDGIVQSVEEELGEPVSFVITGGTAKYVEAMVRHPHTFDPDLTLKGLALLYKRNCS